MQEFFYYMTVGEHLFNHFIINQLAATASATTYS